MKIDNYEQFIFDFRESLNNGYIPEYQDYYEVVYALVRLRKFAEAYEIIKEKLMPIVNDNYKFFIAKELHYCFKSEDAEQILLSIDRLKSHEKYLLAKIYMREGRIDEAEDIFKKIIQNSLNEKIKSKSQKQLLFINNYRKHNSFIEMDYDSFLESGYQLKPGLIVYLEKAPFMIDQNDEGDKYGSIRPYMIWKIDGDTLYLFQVTTRIKEQSFVLLKEHYLNNVCDRTIKDNLCITSSNNVVSIKDKLLDSDFKTVLFNIFKTSYYGPFRYQKGRRIFIENYIGKIAMNSIIKVFDLNTREKNYYYVVNITNAHYTVVKINKDTLMLENNELLELPIEESAEEIIILFNYEIEFIQEQLSKDVLLMPLDYQKELILRKHKNTESN